jgi:multicomponent Na+:H+ antiporter subunit C
MEPLSAIAVGLLIAASAYLILSRDLLRLLLGILILSNGANLLIFTAGRLLREVPPLIPEELVAPLEPVANPLPQALVLTAIVISFSLFAFLLVLVYRCYESSGSMSSDDLTAAEQPGESRVELEVKSEGREAA